MFWNLAKRPPSFAKLSPRPDATPSYPHQMQARQTKEASIPPPSPPWPPHPPYTTCKRVHRGDTAWPRAPDEELARLVLQSTVLYYNPTHVLNPSLKNVFTRIMRNTATESDQQLFRKLKQSFGRAKYQQYTARGVTREIAVIIQSSSVCSIYIRVVTTKVARMDY